MKYATIPLFAFALVGCATTSPAQQTANAELTKRVGERLRYCSITGGLDMGVGGLAAMGTGAATSFNFNCPAAPFPETIPLSPIPDE